MSVTTGLRVPLAWYTADIARHIHVIGVLHTINDHFCLRKQTERKKKNDDIK